MAGRAVVRLQRALVSWRHKKLRFLLIYPRWHAQVNEPAAIVCAPGKSSAAVSPKDAIVVVAAPGPCHNARTPGLPHRRVHANCVTKTAA